MEGDWRYNSVNGNCYSPLYKTPLKYAVQKQKCTTRVSTSILLTIKDVAEWEFVLNFTDVAAKFAVVDNNSVVTTVKPIGNFLWLDLKFSLGMFVLFAFNNFTRFTVLNESTVKIIILVCEIN